MIVIGLGYTRIQHDLTLTKLYLQRSSFQVRSHSKDKGLELENIILGDTIQPTKISLFPNSSIIIMFVLDMYFQMNHFDSLLAPFYLYFS